MCEFISDSRVLPGWGCCRCRVYNGLQREACKVCARPRCELVIPPEVLRCSSCGFGYLAEHLAGRRMTAPGKTLADSGCPVCGASLARSA